MCNGNFSCKKAVFADNGCIFLRCSGFCQLIGDEKLRPERYCCPLWLKITALQQRGGCKAYLGFKVSEYYLKMSKNRTVAAAAAKAAVLERVSVLISPRHQFLHFWIQSGIVCSRVKSVLLKVIAGSADLDELRGWTFIC